MWFRLVLGIWFSRSETVSLSLQYVDKRGKEGVITGARIVVATGNSSSLPSFSLFYLFSPSIRCVNLLYTHAHAHTHMHTHTCTHAHTHMHTHAHTHTRTHAHTHTHTHTHTHHLQVDVLATQTSQEPESMASQATISSHSRRPQAKP